MDYRYETDDSTREFHKKRRTFIIIDNKLEFLPCESTMSHYEYCKQKGISKEKFNTITRGYYLNNIVVFYKDNFIYDNILINESLNYLDIISSNIGVFEFDIYFGVLPDNNFKLDYYYGKYSNGMIFIERK